MDEVRTLSQRLRRFFHIDHGSIVKPEQSMTFRISGLLSETSDAKSRPFNSKLSLTIYFFLIQREPAFAIYVILWHKQYGIQKEKLPDTTCVRSVKIGDECNDQSECIPDEKFTNVQIV
ncbi:unnamed protein product [Acanthoscelides obtectus]|uniref:Uncharacterized protein n=1 Tax=Acanthoscelides obtectus TaxID=200917 RepID=A0A9P0PJV8_ACAOB|nr:unnamed protein product [Acanthoscelides obtectus]CAK1671006.1 hypothetical protein AOBTE_LOCUS27975 [Acanthoscelides obtectus]